MARGSPSDSSSGSGSSSLSSQFSTLCIHGHDEVAAATNESFHHPYSITARTSTATMLSFIFSLYFFCHSVLNHYQCLWWKSLQVGMGCFPFLGGGGDSPEVRAFLFLSPLPSSAELTCKEEYSLSSRSRSGWKEGVHMTLAMVVS